MNVLITCASTKIPLIKQIKKVVSKFSGGLILGGDEETTSATLLFSDKYFILPRFWVQNINAPENCEGD
jgi:hypothetical protein